MNRERYSQCDNRVHRLGVYTVYSQMKSVGDTIHQIDKQMIPVDSLDYYGNRIQRIVRFEIYRYYTVTELRRKTHSQRTVPLMKRN